jgi:hypothetical protein
LDSAIRGSRPPSSINTLYYPTKVSFPMADFFSKKEDDRELMDSIPSTVNSTSAGQNCLADHFETTSLRERRLLRASSPPRSSS